MLLVILILIMVLFGLAGIAPASDIEDVRARVYSWSNAWQNRNINRYMYFYSPTFQTNGLNYKGWMEDKARHFQKSGDIRIGISDLWVFIEGKYATARFLQRYQDTKYSDVGEKTLILINTNGQWKIVSEEWKPLKSPVRTAASQSSRQRRPRGQRKASPVEPECRSKQPVKCISRSSEAPIWRSTATNK